MGIYKYKDLKDGKIAEKYPAKILVAQKVNGDMWEKTFFANNADLVRKLSKFGMGDWMEITFDDTQFKNIKDIKPASPPETPPQEGTTTTTTTTKGAYSNNVRRSDGTSRGDDTNRSAAIYLAERVVAMGNTEANLRKMGEEGVLKVMVAVAAKIFDYITKGEVALNEKCTSCGDDPLDPPSIDD